MTDKDLTLICANFEEFQAELHNAHSGIQTIQSIVNDYVAAEQQFSNKLNFIHDKYTRVLQYSSTLSKPANRVTNQEIVKKLVSNIDRILKQSRENITIYEMGLKFKLAAVQDKLLDHIRLTDEMVRCESNKLRDINKRTESCKSKVEFKIII